MSSYMHLIESTPLVSRIEITTTSGDVEYDGTALEVTDQKGNELFHVIVNATGDRQLLFFRSEGNFRIPLRFVEDVIEVAKEKVHLLDL